MITILKCREKDAPKGFTLAEVLITLVIIGIVAALTIPTLLSRYKEQQTMAKLQKIYSTFSNAYQLTINEHGTPDTWTDIYNVNEAGTLAFWERLKPNLKVAKECDFNNRFDCWSPDDYFISFNGEPTINHIHNGSQKTFILNDGTMLSLSLPNTETKPNPGCVNNDNYFSCANLTVKTDKSDKQVYGKNIFIFRFEHNVFMPVGKNKDMSNCYSLGETCAAWVIYNKNMDYTKCGGLSWNGKKSCK